MKTSSNTTVGIGLFGLGTVGTGVVKILQSQSRDIERKTGVRLVLKKICVKSLSKKRETKVPRGLLTVNRDLLLNDPAIDIVVELIGGIHPAKEIIQKAFAQGKHVVTANKALLAEQGNFIFSEAEKHSRKIGIEASVCGGIPIIKALVEGLAANNISHFLGIVNGTCNFVLSAMSEGSLRFSAALKEAQRAGYAEKDPGLDIDGIDSAHKLAILARLAFRTDAPFDSISVEGIRSLALEDIEYARELGYRIKLLAIGKKLPGGLELRVHPTMLPMNHPLSSVRSVYNAVFMHGDRAGDLLFSGKGAGMFPTASAVVSDIIDIAKNISSQDRVRAARLNKLGRAKVLSIHEMTSKYYLRFQAIDKPGVLGRIAQALGKNNISILSVHQKESYDSKSVPVIILTYEAREKDLRRALRLIDSQREIKEKTVVLRVEK